MNKNPSILPPDVFEAVVEALAHALVHHYRDSHAATGAGATTVAPPSPLTASSPWLTVREAAKRTRCGEKMIYREVAANRLRAVRIGGRTSLRFRAEWIDKWLEASATPVSTRGRVGAPPRRV